MWDRVGLGNGILDIVIFLVFLLGFLALGLWHLSFLYDLHPMLHDVASMKPVIPAVMIYAFDRLLLSIIVRCPL